MKDYFLDSVRWAIIIFWAALVAGTICYQGFIALRPHPVAVHEGHPDDGVDKVIMPERK